MTRASYQAVVIGAGPNGLTAANLLTDAGWQVLLLKSQERIGGAVAGDNSVHPTSPTFSSFYPLAAASPVLTAMELEKHGLIWSHAPSVVGSPAPGRGWALIHHDPDETASGLDKLHPGDGDAWLQMVHTWRQISGPFVDALLTPFPPLKAAARLLPRLPRAGGLSLIKMLVEPSRTLTQTRLKGSAAQLLIAGNAAHADIPPDAAGSGLFGWLLAMLAQDVGFPVAQGGAGHLARALADRFTVHGGDIRCRAEVDRVLTAHGRAIGVRLVPSVECARVHGMRVGLGDRVADLVVVFDGIFGFVVVPALPSFRTCTVDDSHGRADRVVDAGARSDGDPGQGVVPVLAAGRTHCAGNERFEQRAPTDWSGSWRTGVARQ